MLRNVPNYLHTTSDADRRPQVQIHRPGASAYIRSRDQTSRTHALYSPWFTDIYIVVVVSLALLLCKFLASHQLVYAYMPSE